MKIKQHSADQFRTLILKLPLATRTEYSVAIKDLAAIFGINEDLSADQRSKNWHEKPRKPRKKNCYAYEISIRGGNSWLIGSLEDAAKMVLLQPQSLKIYLDRNQDGPKTFCKVVNDEIITIVRHKIKEEDLNKLEVLPKQPKVRY